MALTSMAGSDRDFDKRKEYLRNISCVYREMVGLGLVMRGRCNKCKIVYDMYMMAWVYIEHTI